VGLATFLAAPGCRADSGLTVVNHCKQVVTAVFGSAGADLLTGSQLPPGTFAILPAPSADTGPGGRLEAYTASGACASHTGDARHWDIDDEDLDPAGC